MTEVKNSEDENAPEAVDRPPVENEKAASNVAEISDAIGDRAEEASETAFDAEEFGSKLDRMICETSHPYSETLPPPGRNTHYPESGLETELAEVVKWCLAEYKAHPDKLDEILKIIEGQADRFSGPTGLESGRGASVYYIRSALVRRIAWEQSTHDEQMQLDRLSGAETKKLKQLSDDLAGRLPRLAEGQQGPPLWELVSRIGTKGSIPNRPMNDNRDLHDTFEIIDDAIAKYPPIVVSELILAPAFSKAAENIGYSFHRSKSLVVLRIELEKMYSTLSDKVLRNKVDTVAEAA